MNFTFSPTYVDWASAHQMTQLSRELRAVTFDQTTTSATSLARIRDSDPKSDECDVETGVVAPFNFQKWYCKTPLIYKPNFRGKYFRHSGRVFHWSNSQRASICGEGIDRSIVPRCFGCNTKPIKDLLHEIKGFSLTKEGSRTSLSFASAGLFGLNIYCVSLSEVGLSGSHLTTLFGNLPERCIILLEDIDSSGLRCEGNCSSVRLYRGIDADLATGAKAVAEGQNQSLISLAGLLSRARNPNQDLLNVIDGAASQELTRAAQGRVLVMTKNLLETLDSALIRPGRVDFQVRFTLATREQIRDIYHRMYNDEESTLGVIDPKTNTCDSFTGQDDLCFDLRPSNATVTNLRSKELEELAGLFASKLPEDTFSPADIQGYLLERKKDPERALGEVEG
ncbi:hypothetical protein EJ02DRAFT_470627 [Clathrospora elynae]|uniref:Uncharacterized protein n=1 Tax=Clathrospora elynae TaxID=706981 RepID=A0A6A5S827_9PLEO|nr:hypothetical protein EJ02DRAFT_470627 [Clathrospora elynae]